MASRNRRETHERYIANGGSDSYTKYNESTGKDSYFIGNVNSLADLETRTSGNFLTSPPPSPDNIKYQNNIDILRRYFGSVDVTSFKYGLNFANDARFSNGNNGYVENLEEDPVIYGFDLVINHLTSPLYSANSPKSPFTGDLESFFKFGEDNGISSISNRRNIYNQFMDQMETLFLSTNIGEYDTFKAHYLMEVSGLDQLVNKNTGFTKGKQFTKYGEDKITLKLREDTFLTGGYMAALYKAMSYDKLNGKTIIPDNLLRFDCSIIISEIRNFNLVKRAMNENNSSTLQVFNDNVSRYIYNLYECQFLFDNMTHDSTVSNANKSPYETWDLSFVYKYGNMMMEKFKLNPDLNSHSRFFINTGGVDPNSNRQGSSTLNSSAAGTDGIGTSRVFGYTYNSKDNPYKDMSNITNNGIIEGFSVSDSEIQNLKNASISADAQNQKNEENEERTTIQSVFKNTGEYAVTRIKDARDRLLNDTLQSIRTATGLRRISAPTNVYRDNDSIPGFFRNQLQDFTNERVTNFISGLNN